MYNHQLVIDALVGQVGFERHPLYRLAPSLYASKSGASFNSAHPLINYEHLSAVAEQMDVSVVPAHDPLLTYYKDDVISNGGKLYQLTEATATGAYNQAQWQETNALSILLYNALKSAANEVVSKLMTTKVMERQAKAIFEDLRLFEGVGNITQALPLSGKFRGWEIDMKPENMKDMALRIHAVGFQFTQPSQSLTLYIYHSSQAEPIHTFTITGAGAKLFRWHELQDVFLKYQGGSYIIGYRESELAGAVIPLSNYDFRSSPCASCSGYNKAAYNEWSQYIDVHPFTVDESSITGDELWDLELNRYNYTNNNGMNLALTLECDATETLTRQAHVFKNAMLYGVAHRLLLEMKYTDDNSALAEKARQAARHELDEMALHPTGVVRSYQDAMKALDMNLSGLNSRCFPAQTSKIATRWR